MSELLQPGRRTVDAHELDLAQPLPERLAGPRRHRHGVQEREHEHRQVHQQVRRPELGLRGGELVGHLTSRACPRPWPSPWPCRPWPGACWIGAESPFFFAAVRASSALLFASSAFDFALSALEDAVVSRSRVLRLLGVLVLDQHAPQRVHDEEDHDQHREVERHRVAAPWAAPGKPDGLSGAARSSAASCAGSARVACVPPEPFLPSRCSTSRWCRAPCSRGPRRAPVARLAGATTATSEPSATGRPSSTGGERLVVALPLDRVREDVPRAVELAPAATSRRSRPRPGTRP